MTFVQKEEFAKFSLCREAGVREYWIVDPASQTIKGEPPLPLFYINLLLVQHCVNNGKFSALYL
ncbi:Uma2 family endonuclease [Clostridiaceae bacterium]|nr:Uma2 family endonuclease [Clostridiaceae bacterium]